MGKVVPLFQTFDQLRSNEYDVLSEHYEAWNKAFARYLALDAVLKGDTDALAKCSSVDADLAKSEAARRMALLSPETRKYNPDHARVHALKDFATELRTLCEKRDERLFGLSAVAKRSLRFARATPSRVFAGSATILGLKR